MNEQLNFLINLSAVLKAWFIKYGFQNLILLVIAFFMLVFIKGGFWNWIGSGLIWYFAGRNVEAIKQVWLEIKKNKKMRF